MSQINLLSSERKSHQIPWYKFLRLLVKLSGLIMILELGAWGYLYYVERSIETKIFDTQNEIKTVSNTLANSKERKELVARQGQIKNYNTLVSAQSHWSSFLTDRLARVTLKTSRYVAVNGDSNGSLRLTVSVPTYADLDKFLQIFDVPDMNKVFSDIKVISLSKSQVGDKLDIRFEVSMKYRPEALKTSTK